MRRTASIVLLGLLGCLSAAAPGCAPRPSQGPKDPARRYETLEERGDPGDTAAARAANARAVELIGRKDFAGAEAALKEALGADVMHGPAHNNLGKVYYHQGRLYLAAWEFQYAAKLMPNQPEPLNNLGLVFEAAGKLDDAVESYGKATGFEPDNPQFIGNLARARLRRGERGSEVQDLLDKLVLRDTRPEWAEWAKRTLSRLRVERPE